MNGQPVSIKLLIPHESPAYVELNNRPLIGEHIEYLNQDYIIEGIKHTASPSTRDMLTLGLRPVIPFERSFRS